MKGIIDHFEEDIVVVEIDGEIKDFSRNIFPKYATVGDVVLINGGKIEILKHETIKQKKEIEELMDELFE